MPPAPDLAGRFAADLDALVEPGARLGVAVSGGPDSIALLLLARQVRPGRVLAATVDHGLRPESGAEASTVAALCRELDIPHSILQLDWPVRPAANIQVAARHRRYAALAAWAADQKSFAVATGHHLDDQAETLLLRLARGAGIGGLSGVQRCRPIDGAHPNVQLVRPLLSWRRETLAELVAAAGIEPLEDPSNSDSRFDRTQARTLLATTEWLDPMRLAAVADHARDAEEALAYATSDLLRGRVSSEGGAVSVRAAGLPHELQRRLLLLAISQLSASSPTGPQVSSALDKLRSGNTTTLAGLKLTGGEVWRVEPAPPRRPVKPT